MLKVNYVYCDSNIFLAYFNAEPGRIDLLEQLFEEIHQNKFKKLITSPYSIIEVAYVASEKSVLLPEVETKFDKFWGDSSLVEFVDFHENLARQARNLMRQAATKGYRLQSADALHLVSARSVGVEKFFTYDDKLFKYADILGFNILQPHVVDKK